MTFRASAYDGADDGDGVASADDGDDMDDGDGADDGGSVDGVEAARATLRVTGAYHSGNYRSPPGACVRQWVGVRYAGGAGQARWAERGLDAPEGEGWGASAVAGLQRTRATAACDPLDDQGEPRADCPDPVGASTERTQGGGQLLGGYSWEYVGAHGGVLVTPGSEWRQDLTLEEPATVLPAFDVHGRYRWASLHLGLGMPCVGCVPRPSAYAALELRPWESLQVTVRGGVPLSGLELRWRVLDPVGIVGGFSGLGEPGGGEFGYAGVFVEL